ncbi:MAG: hypothetical protein QM232_02915 [Bacteroidota bacterium]|jgi:hypothetical protein|nr:hypothetical protein [Bacteroidota bacterium]HPB13059.1 hypothetical protein [Bacteroidales bacterium]
MLNFILIMRRMPHLLINGLPPKPEPMKSDLSRDELDRIHKSYLERLREE